VPLTRRDLLVLAGAALPALDFASALVSEGAPAMYGLIGKIRAQPGQRDALAAILLEGVAGMPGCRSYVVALDPADADALWVTEVWESVEHHRASLGLPSVQQAIARGKPLIAGFGERFETQPVGGHGLAPGA
jgi:quinol monooxygenase YgiN